MVRIEEKMNVLCCELTTATGVIYQRILFCVVHR